MKTTPTILILFLLTSLSCNPDCGLTAFFEVDGIGFQHDQEILIKASPTTVLQGKDVMFSSGNSAASVIVGSDQTRYIPNVGLLVKVPRGISGTDVDMFIDDPDCGPLSLGSSVVVGDEEFFTDNPDFIVPPNLNFIIPVSTPIIPPLVRNAWVHPTVTDYCVWFRFVLDENDNETKTICPATSAELSINCDGTPDLYHKNPVYGVIDKENNYINFFIDRTSKNAGVEEFEGQFIDVDDSEYGGTGVPECGAWTPGRTYMMLVTSKQTGRQLVLYQQLKENDLGLGEVALENELSCRS